MLAAAGVVYHNYMEKMRRKKRRKNRGKMAVIGVIQDNLYKSRDKYSNKRIKKKCSGLPVMIHQVSEIRGYNSTYALLNAVVIRDADIVVVELDRLNDIRLKYPDISENISIAAVLKAGNPGNVLITRKFEKSLGMLWHCVIQYRL